MKQLITCSLKDEILRGFIERNEASFSADIKEMANHYNISWVTMMAILEHFENLGFIKREKTLEGETIFYIKVPAYDFFSHGGFLAQEELLKANLEKLILEIESLKPSIPDKVESLTAIASNIATALGLFLAR